MIYMIDIIDEDELVVSIEERLGVQAFLVVIINLDSDGIDEYDKMVVGVHTPMHKRGWILI